jgi:hypothetical protein
MATAIIVGLVIGGIVGGFSCLLFDLPTEFTNAVATAYDLMSTGTALEGTVYLTDLPDGIFKDILTFWESMRIAYGEAFEFLGNFGVTILGYSPISVFLGSGLTVYFAYTMLKWCVGKT